MSIGRVGQHERHKNPMMKSLRVESTQITSVNIVNKVLNLK